jgi:hypothetical protein
LGIRPVAAIFKWSTTLTHFVRDRHDWRRKRRFCDCALAAWGRWRDKMPHGERTPLNDDDNAATAL